MFTKELKRAIINKNFILIIIFSIFLFLFSSYDTVWRGAFSTIDSGELTLEGLERVLEYSRNKYHIWVSSYTYISIIFPIIIVWLYLYSYTEERNNKFRYLVISRCGRVKYLANKFLAIAVSGGLALAVPEMIYYILISSLARSEILTPFQLQPYGLYSQMFNKNPDGYILIIILLHFAIGFTFSSFSIGISTFLNNRISVLLIPFAVYLVMDIVISGIKPIRNYALLTAYKCMHRDNYIITNFIIINVLILLIGIILFWVNESRRFKNG